ncbi:Nitrobenzene nitroreductase [Pseudocercospora fuligena]|uniref:Nitrobenzene nitroreductase n=1 Tax=Pseudocercospora fuligena TaxID=685502 RepID=A0A8H6RJJ5_9PEZI|nr:Nitrobenzene nitroreductase [Pseudocercospora fuligena]
MQAGQGLSFQDCVRQRHSCRVFKSDPVPATLLRECLELARLAPSNSNVQNWRLTIASGAARDRAVAPLTAASLEGEPVLPAVPEKFQRYRNELVKLIYGEQGYSVMGDDHREERQAKRLLQWEFFRAPTCAVISMDDCFGLADALSVGMFVNTFALALTERGVGCCFQISVTGYPEALRSGFQLDDGQQILCGMAIGWPVEEHPVNNLKFGRDPIEKQVTFL